MRRCKTCQCKETLEEKKETLEEKLEAHLRIYPLKEDVDEEIIAGIARTHFKEIVEEWAGGYCGESVRDLLKRMDE